MSYREIIAIAIVMWLVCLAGFIYVWSRKPRSKVQERDTDRAALESDGRLDELRTYTRPHMRGNTAYGKELP